MAINAPHLFINAYLQSEISRNFGTSTPFLPTLPADIDSLTETFPESNGFLAVYDRMLKLRRKAFPHIKCEQIMYYFYKSEDPTLIYETQQLTQDLLDRGDESAQELNDWIKSYQASNPGEPSNGKKTATIGGQDFLLPYFHEIKIFQLEESRDIIDFGTARTFAGNKIIIDYEWHAS
jgi:hypothetical protein